MSPALTVGWLDPQQAPALGAMIAVYCRGSTRLTAKGPEALRKCNASPPRRGCLGLAMDKSEAMIMPLDGAIIFVELGRPY
jgi:hypothetical protein